LQEAQLNVVLLRHTPDPELACAAAAKQCYSAAGVKDLQEKMSPEKVGELLDTVVRGGHHSVLEHASFTFGIEGVSRACTHQLVRHRLASYSQQSQRYVEAKTAKFVVPPKIRTNEKAFREFARICDDSAASYGRLVELGIDREDARFVLPNAAETKIVVTMNARELLHFFELRCCNRAQWEIRRLALRMLEECRKAAPRIFGHAGPTCETQKICWEGKMSCGKWKQIKGTELREKN